MVANLADRKILDVIFARLPLRQAGAVYLRYWYGLTDAEIGQRHGISEAVAKQLRERGLKKLQEVLPNWKPST